MQEKLTKLMITFSLNQLLSVWKDLQRLGILILNLKYTPTKVTYSVRHDNLKIQWQNNCVDTTYCTEYIFVQQERCQDFINDATIWKSQSPEIKFFFLFIPVFFVLFWFLVFRMKVLRVLMNQPLKCSVFKMFKIYWYIWLSHILVTPQRDLMCEKRLSTRHNSILHFQLEISGKSCECLFSFIRTDVHAVRLSSSYSADLSSYLKIHTEVSRL